MSISITRRTFAGSAAALAFSESLLAKKRVPVGIELYSVRDELSKDLMGTVTKVAKMGYEVMEFFSPYYQWTPDYAKQVRKLLDDTGTRCLSTHNSADVFTPEGIRTQSDYRIEDFSYGKRRPRNDAGWMEGCGRKALSILRDAEAAGHARRFS